MAEKSLNGLMECNGGIQRTYSSGKIGNQGARIWSANICFGLWRDREREREAKIEVQVAFVFPWRAFHALHI